MNKCTDTLIMKMLLQLVSTRAKHREDVIHMVFLSTRYHDVGMMYLFAIAAGYVSSTLVVRIKIFQFHVKYGCLYVVQTAVLSQIVEDIFPRRSIVAQRTDNGGDFVVVGRYRTSIAQCAKILAWIEAKGCGMAQRTNERF